ncbi:type II toxin-antitoxin system RelE/ParE family toxin [Bacteroides sp. 51]|uniref:type II toxin-antitoxin system RelE/ParE family toxin n=1 Tax=Bacteroides sp. 51 TaxID=2302938 RepID=UPI0013D80408|nr:type II toxin-antitoxin system RelE/ParE family toxin [Bacteroides sp. 51]NDV81640.1 type II toxin-antitoxin system RelE/ParE family toxin [Bacteroides sp. 51]
MILRWSPRAEMDLTRIHTWYAQQAGLKTADRILYDIWSSAELLRTHPNLGYLEPLLESFPQSFRTCIDAPNYKIIYWVEDDIVKVATVFDCRQRPEHLVHIFSTGSDWVCEPQVEYKKIR